jgi:hypothetical protein
MRPLSECVNEFVISTIACVLKKPTCSGSDGLCNGMVCMHRRNMGKPEIEALLNMLANERHVAASTHNQA